MTDRRVLRLFIVALGGLLTAACGGGSSAPVSGGDGSPPNISVSGASHGDSVQGTLPLSAAATDSVGVDDVVLYIDNHPITGGPGSHLAYSFDTTKRKDGWVAVTFGARDGAGNWGWESLAVWVGNQTQTPDSPPPVVEPPVIVPNPDPDPAPAPLPPPPPPVTDNPQPMPVIENPAASGAGTEESPMHIRSSVDYTQYDPTYPYIMLLGVDLGETIWDTKKFDVITSDDKGVRSIKVYAGHTLLREVDEGATTVLIDTTLFPDGLFNLQIYTYDGDLHYITEFACFINNSADHERPDLQIKDFEKLDPGDRSITISGQYRLQAEASDEAGLASLALFVAGQQVAEAQGSGTVAVEYLVDTSNWPGYDPDSQTPFYVPVAVRATDTAGNIMAQSFRLRFTAAAP